MLTRVFEVHVFMCVSVKIIQKTQDTICIDLQENLISKLPTMEDDVISGSLLNFILNVFLQVIKFYLCQNNMLSVCFGVRVSSSFNICTTYIVRV